MLTSQPATAEEQRTLWLEVGVALMYGKIKENRPVVKTDARGRSIYQKFSEWFPVMFTDLGERTASAALWFAKNSAILAEIPADLTHPVAIQEWADKQQAAQALPLDLQETPAPVPTATLPKATAVKVNKLVHRSTTNDEGSETAARHLKAFAKQEIKQKQESPLAGAPLDIPAGKVYGASALIRNA